MLCVLTEVFQDAHICSQDCEEHWPALMAIVGANPEGICLGAVIMDGDETKFRMMMVMTVLLVKERTMTCYRYSQETWNDIDE